ncbi:MAG: T9SS type A sorting domain-containing protein [Aureispira sp.]
MKLLCTLFLIILSSSAIWAQNVDYNARITRFFGSDCGEIFDEEWTWYGFLSDNVNTAETSSGCIQCDRNSNCTRTGTYASRSRTNIAATQIRARIDAWEDDRGSRCAHDGGDDCRTRTTCTYNFLNPLEYQYTSINSPTCGNNDFNMNTFYQYRYATVSLDNATEYTATPLTLGGNRPFWGSRGSWAAVGSDCATSGTIGNNQTSSFSTQVTCKRQVTFRWRVSSQANSDYLEVYVNGTRRNRISGVTGWATMTLNLDFGNNTVEWRYVKDGFGSLNEDRGFVDEVRFIDATNLTPGGIAGNQSICSGGNPNNLTSTNSGTAYSDILNYQWQFSNNNSTWANIGGATALTYNPPAGLTQTRYYRRRLQDGCGFTGVSNVVIVTVNPLPNGNLVTPGPICAGAATNITFNSSAGTGPFDIQYNGTTLNNINSGTTISVSPSNTTTYTLSSITDNNGCVATTGLGTAATVTVNPIPNGNLVAPGSICAGTTMNITFNSSVGTGPFDIQYNGTTLNNINNGSTISLSPSSTTTYTLNSVTDNNGCVATTGLGTAATVTVNPIPNGNLVTTGPICAGTATNITFNGSAGTGPFDIQYNGTTLNNINSGANISVSPSSTTTYTLSSVTDNNGCVRTTSLGTAATVTVNTNSTAPTIATVSNKICPNSSLTLTASGGTAGTGSNIEWFSGPNGTGTSLGTGANIMVSPMSTTTYYARRQGICNTTNDDSEQVEIRDYVYTPVGLNTSTGYCTDNAGWHHFFNANDDIIFSMRGDLTGATANPVARINNNGTAYQTAVNVVGSCVNGYSPGDELFEMPRSWNVDFTGTTNGTYDIRYYFPANEKTDLETAAMNHIANNPACNYSYTYANPNGFYWFKNVGTAYTAPLFDQPTKLTGVTNSINGINYAEITGITSFSGGAGAIRLSPAGSLPVELSSFKGWNVGSSNTLQWTTESELNNNRFELERSADGQNFDLLATVAGAGTTNEFQSYLQEDKTPLLGINYYRLRQIDHDGATSLSSVIAIEVATKEGAQRFFPNPTTGKLTYQFNAVQQEQLTLTVHNTLGQVLNTWSQESHVGINNKVLDWRDYPAGTYHVSVYNSQGRLIHTQAVIKKMP